MDISAISKKALSHGLGSIEEGGGPLIPFSMVLDESNPDPGERVLSLTRHVAEYLEEALQLAQDSISPAPGITRYAIAWDGFVTVEGRRWDAILVEAGEASSPEGFILAQRYEPKETGFLFKKRRRNVAVGEPLMAGATPSRLWEVRGAS